MNHYELDWTELLACLPNWEGLELEERRALLDGTGGPHASQLPGELRLALCAMATCEVFRGGGSSVAERDAFVRHVRATLERPEVEAVYRGQTGTLPAWKAGGAYLALVQRGLDGAGYPRSFLAAKDRKAWLAARTESGTKPPGVAVVRDLAVLLVAALERDAPVRLSQLPALHGPKSGASLPKARLARALGLGVRHLFLVPALDDDLLPVLGVAPSVARAWSEPLPVVSRSVAPTETFVGLPLFDDLLTLLVLCSKPQRVRRGQGGLFARSEGLLRQRMLPIPSWVPTTTDPARRVEQVLAAAAELGLTEVQSPTSKAPCLGLTDAGRTWLAAPRARQLERLVEPSRTALAAAREGRLRGPATWGLSPVRDHVDELVAAYRTLFAAAFPGIANP
ncbi:MAG: hypothetical protein P1V81_07110, partial [Planctomycetota bacterium]|nr:hypothetical protein [Planctomycetota bacterium]